MSSRLTGAALVVLCCWVPGVVEAQVHDDEARGLYLAGAAAYEAGRFEESLAYFQRSYELSPHPELLYNIGQAADRARQDAIALDALRRYLAAMPELADRAVLEGRIRVLEAAVARGTAAAPPGPEIELTETTEPDPAATFERAPAATEPTAAPVASASEDPGGGLDAGGVVLVVLGSAVAVAGAVLLGLGVSDSSAVANPRPDEVFYAQALDRQQTGLAMAWSGVAALGVGAILAVLGAIVLGTSGPADDDGSVSLDAHGLRVSF